MPGWDCRLKRATHDLTTWCLISYLEQECKAPHGTVERLPFNLSTVPWGRHLAFLLFQIRRWDTPRSGDLSEVIQQVSNGAGNPTQARILFLCQWHASPAPLLWTKFTSQRLSPCTYTPTTSNPMCHLSDTLLSHKPFHSLCQLLAFHILSQSSKPSQEYFPSRLIKLLSLWRWLFINDIITLMLIKPIAAERQVWLDLHSESLSATNTQRNAKLMVVIILLINDSLMISLFSASMLIGPLIVPLLASHH